MGGWEQKKTLDGMVYYHNKDTNELSYDKPEKLRSNTEKETDWTWVPDPDLVWAPAKRTKTKDDGTVVCKKQDGTIVEVPKDGKMRDTNTKGREQLVEFWPLSPASLKMIEDDLIMLDNINKGLIMHTLRERYMKNELYTWVGASHSVLVSVNPYARLPLYGDEQIDEHRNKTPNKVVPPHVFDIANDSYDSMLFDSIDQSVLISGESGAGKTEATKQCLKFIAKVAGSEANVETKILQANPVLEAYGNAKTIRNNNSSRFGKWIEVYFAQGRAASITSAKITNYLLEKSRLVHQQGGGAQLPHLLTSWLTRTPALRAKFKLGDAPGLSPP